MEGKEIYKVSSGRHYFFVKPMLERSTSAHSRAMQLSEIDHVNEVIVTEGECGFVVIAKNVEGHQAVARSIRRIARGEVVGAAGVYRYAKRRRKK